MFSVKALVERLRLFERNRVPWNLKVLGLAMYFQTSSLRRRLRRLVAVDEACVKVNGQRYRVYSALDIDRNELISMRAYPARNIFTSEPFLKEVLKHCRGNWSSWWTGLHGFREALTELGLLHQHQGFRPRSLVESSFSSFKQRKGYSSTR